MTTIITCCLMTYGISFIVALTHGPFGLCGVLREKIQLRFEKTDWIKEGVECPVCVSFWCGMMIAAFFGDEFFRTWLTSVGFVCLVSALSPD